MNQKLSIERISGISLFAYSCFSGGSKNFFLRWPLRNLNYTKFNKETT